LANSLIGFRSGHNQEDSPQQELRYDQAEGHQAEEEGADRQLEREGDVCGQEQVKYHKIRRDISNIYEGYIQNHQTRLIVHPRVYECVIWSPTMSKTSPELVFFKVIHRDDMLPGLKRLSLNALVKILEYFSNESH
jgi:hypothetical protein